jgi:protein TonB
MAVYASLFEMALIAILILAPLLFNPVLPQRILLNAVMLAPVPFAPSTPPPPVAKQIPRATPVRQFNPEALISPVTVPDEVLITNDAPTPVPDTTAEGIPGGMPALTVTNSLNNWISSAPVIAPPAKVEVAPPAPPPSTPERIDIGGDVQAALILQQVQPVYPPLARKARIQGRVKLHAVIGTDGKIKNVSVLSGPPLLVEAAVHAVMQWIYRPTILDGKPVEVNTDILVRFTIMH